MRRVRRALTALVAALVLLPSAPSPVRAAPTLPAGFVDELVTAVGAPTALAFTPDGRMLVTTQPGVLRMLSGGVLETVLDLSSVTCSNSERGLLGVDVDPAFGTNGYVYLYYTYSKSGTCVNRLSRFTMPGDVIDVATELVLLDDIPSPAGNHNAGDVRFGNDGLLYVTVGDGGCDYAGGGCGGSNDASRDRNTLLGKVLRITPDGGIPTTNPFVGSGTARCDTGNTSPGTICQETFAWGLRNPFRFAFDPNAAGTVFYINDVGQNTWEEIDLAEAGADYGWNVREGHCATGSTTNCGTPPAGMTNPIYDYAHSSGCRSITGGAFVPNGVWPSTYDGAYLFSDYVCGRIFRLVPGGGGGFTTQVFADGLGSNSAVHLIFGPHAGGQALYYTSYNNGGEVHRIVWTGSNAPPVPQITSPGATKRFAVGESLVLKGTASDPDDGTLPASTLTWTVVVRHDAHTHPLVGPVNGNSIPFTGPEPEDLAAAETSYLEISLTATDSSGETATTTRVLNPWRVPLTFRTRPAGLHVLVDGSQVTGPTTVTSWRSWRLEISAPDQSPYHWVRWKPRGPQTRTITTPKRAKTYTAFFAPN